MSQKATCRFHVKFQQIQIFNKGYLYEYPWRKPWLGLVEEAECYTGSLLDNILFTPSTIEYLLEGDIDLSLENGVNMELPSFKLLDLLNISADKDDHTRYIDSSGEDVFRFFQDTRTNKFTAAVKKKLFLGALKKSGFACLWAVAGEKLLHSPYLPRNQYARRAYTSIAYFNDHELVGTGPWFEDSWRGISKIDRNRPDS